MKSSNYPYPECYCPDNLSGDFLELFRCLMTWTWIQERWAIWGENPDHVKGRSYFDEGLDFLAINNGINSQDCDFLELAEIFFKEYHHRDWRMDEFMSATALVQGSASIFSEAGYLLKGRKYKIILRVLRWWREAVRQGKRPMQPWIDDLVSASKLKRLGLEHSWAIDTSILREVKKENRDGWRVRIVEQLSGSLSSMGWGKGDCAVDFDFTLNQTSIQAHAALMAHEVRSAPVIPPAPRLDWLEGAAFAFGSDEQSWYVEFERLLREYVFWQEANLIMLQGHSKEKSLGSNLYERFWGDYTDTLVADSYLFSKLLDGEKSLPMQSFLKGYHCPVYSQVQDLRESDLMVLRSLLEDNPGDWLYAHLQEKEREILKLKDSLAREGVDAEKEDLLPLFARRPHLFEFFWHWEREVGREARIALRKTHF